VSASTPAGAPTIVVYDASALLAWLLQTADQWQRVDRLMRRPADGVMSVPALTEAIYVARRRGNQATPGQLRTALLGQGLRVEPSSEDDAEWAGAAIAESEANPAQWTTTNGPRTGTLSLGDGLTLALAVRLGGHAVTFDGAWFNFPTQTFPVVNAWRIPL
jgi:PIN domain nuclease of toxin-antitoxin system